MQLRRLFVWLAGIALLAPVSVFAGQKNEGKFTVAESVQFGTSQLKPGDYKVQWEGSGSDVQIKVLQYGKVVATAPGKLVPLEQVPGRDSVTLDATNDVRKVEKIDFAKQKQELVISDSSMASGR